MCDKKYKVIISRRAADELIAHIGFLARVSQEAAEKLRREVIDAVRELEFMPERNPRVVADELPYGKCRKKLVAKRYLLIYQIKNKNVFVDYILDCRSDYQWLL